MSSILIYFSAFNISLLLTSHHRDLRIHIERERECYSACTYVHSIN